jgi:hypothetical protein
MSEFENPYFTVSIPFDHYDKIVSKEKSIVIRCKYNCYCYDETPKPTDFYIIKSDFGNITERMIIQELIKLKHNPQCDHMFYEGVSSTPLDDVFDIYFSS